MSDEKVFEGVIHQPKYPPTTWQVILQSHWPETVLMVYAT
jgi:hypothetical protein